MSEYLSIYRHPRIGALSGIQFPTPYRDRKKRADPELVALIEAKSKNTIAIPYVPPKLLLIPPGSNSFEGWAHPVVTILSAAIV